MTYLVTKYKGTNQEIIGKHNDIESAQEQFKSVSVGSDSVFIEISGK